MKIRILLTVMLLLVGVTHAWAQQTAFTYQGKLTDGGTAANGNYDLQFALFDAADGTNQIGQTKTLSSVPVSAGIFTVTLDFGANAFSGAARFLEISARPGGAASFTLLTPRQPLNATPYAVRSLNAANADTADNAQQLAGVAASQYVKADDARLADARDPKAGNSNYVQNSTSQQAAANFNISGNGTAGGILSANAVNSVTQYNIDGTRVLGFFPNNLLKLGTNNRVSIGSNLASAPFWLEVESPDKYGLRVGTLANGGTALSVGGAGDFAVDSNGTPAGRFVVKENGNVGIGMNNPPSKLSVAGTVEGLGGFKFVDGSVQTNAVGKVYTALIGGELEIDRNGSASAVASLTLPPGVYLITASIQFENRANDFLQENSRNVRCYFNNEFLGVNHMGKQGDTMDWLQTTMHTVFTQVANGPVSLRCGNLEPNGKVFARDRRFTAVRVGDSPN